VESPSAPRVSPPPCGHAVDLAQEQRREAVAVHRSGRRLGRDEPRIARLLQHLPQPALDLLGISPTARQIAIAHQRDARERGDCHVLRVVAIAKRSILVLLLHQIGKPTLD
jgi:hypothetical protein